MTGAATAPRSRAQRAASFRRNALALERVHGISCLRRGAAFGIRPSLSVRYTRIAPAICFDVAPRPLPASCGQHRAFIAGGASSGAIARWTRGRALSTNTEQNAKALNASAISGEGTTHVAHGECALFTCLLDTP